MSSSAARGQNSLGEDLIVTAADSSSHQTHLQTVAEERRRGGVKPVNGGLVVMAQMRIPPPGWGAGGRIFSRLSWKETWEHFFDFWCLTVVEAAKTRSQIYWSAKIRFWQFGFGTSVLKIAHIKIFHFLTVVKAAKGRSHARGRPWGGWGVVNPFTQHSEFVLSVLKIGFSLIWWWKNAFGHLVFLWCSVSYQESVWRLQVCFFFHLRDILCYPLHLLRPALNQMFYQGQLCHLLQTRFHHKRRGTTQIELFFFVVVCFLTRTTSRGGRGRLENV